MNQTNLFSSFLRISVEKKEKGEDLTCHFLRNLRQVPELELQK